MMTDWNPTRLERAAAIAGFATFTLLGCCATVVMLWQLYWAYAWARLLGLDHIRYLDLPVAAEMGAYFCGGVLMLALGALGLWRTVKRKRHDR
jgi:TRAP-type C4-dicarboxylate transport system permease small subunit